jgi:hypothetical protein
MCLLPQCWNCIFTFLRFLRAKITLFFFIHTINWQLAGTVSRDFRPCGTPGSTDAWVKAVLNIGSNSRRNSIRFDYENRLRAIRHRTESQIRAMPFSAEFFGIARSRNKILSAFTEAVKVTVFQQISHMRYCLHHGSKIQFYVLHYLTKKKKWLRAMRHSAESIFVF